MIILDRNLITFVGNCKAAIEKWVVQSGIGMFICFSLMSISSASGGIDRQSNLIGKGREISLSFSAISECALFEILSESQKKSEDINLLFYGCNDQKEVLVIVNKAPIGTVVSRMADIFGWSFSRNKSKQSDYLVTGSLKKALPLFEKQEIEIPNSNGKDLWRSGPLVGWKFLRGTSLCDVLDVFESLARKERNFPNYRFEAEIRESCETLVLPEDQEANDVRWGHSVVYFLNKYFFLKKQLEPGWKEPIKLVGEFAGEGLSISYTPAFVVSKEDNWPYFNYLDRKDLQTLEKKRHEVNIEDGVISLKAALNIVVEVLDKDSGLKIISENIPDRKVYVDFEGDISVLYQVLLRTPNLAVRFPDDETMIIYGQLGSE